MKQIEILAPAGSYDSLVAAINASCDAVYIGGSRFGARAYANNLTDEEMIKAIDYAHLHNKSIYLTVNTLLKQKELMEELYEYILTFYQAGIDAVIVQDVGVMSFIHKHFKDLPIHASTQMTITMSKSLELLKETGVTRIVTSRELSLEEIKSIRQETDLEIESFVHGALCYCYSGQCLMSSILGGRSGNRGRCAQPCRMPYSLFQNRSQVTNDKELYLLSPKDICTLEMIPDLVESGINSFKIEGRMKRPEYAALTSYLYRKYTDKYLELGNEKYKDYLLKNAKEFKYDTSCLMELYNRGGFTQGYYYNKNGKFMMSMQRPNHSGVCIGQVTESKGNRVTLHAQEDLNPQDILEFRNDNGEALYEYTVKAMVNQNKSTETNVLPGSNIKKGDSVYRTKNNALLNEIAGKYLKQEQKIGINGVFNAHIGQAMKLSLTYQDNNITVTGDIIEAAMKQPITEEKIKEQLNKTNTTSFTFETLIIDMDSSVFIPVGKLNEIRRQALEQLYYSIVSKFHRKEPNKFAILEPVNGKDIITNESNQSIGINVMVGNLTQLDTALSYSEVNAIYLRTEDVEFADINQAAMRVTDKGKEFYLTLPYIFRKETYEEWVQAIEEKKLVLDNQFIRGFIIRNLESYHFLVNHINFKARPKKIILDYNMHIMNKEAKEFWKNQGVSHFTSSIELNYQELRHLGCKDMDVIVYGHIPLMTTAQCVVNNTVGCDEKARISIIKDRMNKNFYVANHCRYCYNTIYNGLALSLLNYKDDITDLKPKQIRIDFTIEDSDETALVLKDFIDVFRYNKEAKHKMNDYTKGHFKRGVE